MPSHNQHPKSTNNEFTSPAEPEKVTYTDGAVNLRYRKRGDTIQLGPESTFKYTRSLGEGGMDRVIVRTRSGNTYGIGDGMVLNARERTALQLGDNGRELPPIEIDKPWQIPGKFSTSDVAEIEVRYKYNGFPMGEYALDEQLPGESPFDSLEETITAIRESQSGHQNPQQ